MTTENPVYKAVVPVVLEAFAELEDKHNMITESGGKAGNIVIGNRLKDYMQEEPQLLGAIYYNSLSHRNFRSGHDLHIRYIDRTNSYGSRLTNIGKTLADVLSSHGLVVEWSGNPIDCVIVKSVESYAKITEPEDESEG